MVTQQEKTVLIIEKYPHYTQQLVRQIIFAGLKPVVALTGAGGLRKVAERRPDLILLEVALTDMDGLEFVATLRRRPEWDCIPVVAMSVFPHLKSKCLQGGCSDFLQKPVKMIELMGNIRKFLHHSVTLTQDASQDNSKTDHGPQTPRSRQGSGHK